MCKSTAAEYNSESHSQSVYQYVAMSTLCAIFLIQIRDACFPPPLSDYICKI